MRLSRALALGSAVVTASAHSTFQQLWIGSVDAGSSCVRLPFSNSPVTSVSGSVSLLRFRFFSISDNRAQDIACNAAASSNGVCQIKGAHAFLISS